MAYEKKNIDSGKKKGIFEDNVFDPKSLELDDHEKKKLHSDFLKHSQEASLPAEEEPEELPKRSEKEKKEINIELNFLEKIWSVVLSMLGVMTIREFKMNKVIHGIEKELQKVKPSVYNSASKRVTRFFGYKVHDLFNKLYLIKSITDQTMMNKDLWCCTDQINKTGVEILFERMAGLNTQEVDSYFSYQGISKLISDFDSTSKAIDTVDQAVSNHIHSFEKTSIESINKIYTNLIYFRALVDFDFAGLFRRFDSSYSPASAPNFVDIMGETISPYISSLEEALLQIDLTLNNVTLFKILDDIKKYMEHIVQNEASLEGNVEVSESIYSIEPAQLESSLLLLIDTMRNLLYSNQLTLLLQVIRRDPFYGPSFIHTRFDLYKIYSETFEQRVKTITRLALHEKKKKKIEEAVNRIFQNFKWAGIYSKILSDKLEENSYLGFAYHYHMGVIYTFLTDYYDEIIKMVINLVLMNGNFVDKSFQKKASEAFYTAEKFEEKFRDFIYDINPEGPTGKKLTIQMAKKEGTPAELKKNAERIIVTINGTAKDLFDEFYGLFIDIVDIVNLTHSDLENQPGHYIRNIHSIGGIKNQKFLTMLESSFKTIQAIKEVVNLLKD